MGIERELVSQKRGYRVLRVVQAKQIVERWLVANNIAHNLPSHNLPSHNLPSHNLQLGLPEIDDRYHVWRVPLCAENGNKVGEVIIDAYTAEILFDKTTHPEIIATRLSKQNQQKPNRKKKQKYQISSLQNTIGFGDCVELIKEIPAESIDLIFTSPPYFNARPEYSDFEEYETYLSKMRQVIQACHRVLAEGRFFVINVAPVLLRRASRNQASKRIAVPFDMHRIFVEEGYDFIDDIIWLKPEGAGWATGRGRRFAADRNPLQYKAVPVTEYILVYRKQTDLLIDWHIRNHPQPEVVKDSKIADGYERTNVWKINPATNAKHPAAFPKELAEKVISYYSFKGDVVLDPFAGSGTVGAAAAELDRRFVLLENNPTYIRMIQQASTTWKNISSAALTWINCDMN